MNISGVLEIWTPRLASLARASQYFPWNNHPGLCKTTLCCFDFSHIKPLPSSSLEIHSLSGSYSRIRVNNKALTRARPSCCFICNTTHCLLSPCPSQSPTAHQVSLTLQYCILLPREQSFQPTCFTQYRLLLLTQGEGLIDVHLTRIQWKQICTAAADYQQFTAVKNCLVNKCYQWNVEWLMYLPNG